jgi:hypothetical protein
MMEYSFLLALVAVVFTISMCKAAGKKTPKPPGR